jgi:hypothetical protein
MLRLRPSLSPILRRPVVTPCRILLRPPIQQPSVQFRRQLGPQIGSSNRQFSLFGLFHTSKDAPNSDPTIQGANANREGPTSSNNLFAEQPTDIASGGLPSSTSTSDISPISSVLVDHEGTISAASGGDPSLPSAADSEIVVSLTEELLSKPIIAISEIFTTVHDSGHLSWFVTIVAITTAFRLASHFFLDFLANRRAKVIRSTFEPMRTALTSYMHNPKRSSSTRGLSSGVQNWAKVLIARLSHHHTLDSKASPPFTAILAQIPVFLCTSEALRAMIGTNPGLLGLVFGDWTPIDPKLRGSAILAVLHRPDMAHDTFISFLGNLAVPDPSGLLPLAFTGLISYNMYSAWKGIRNRGAGLETIGGGIIVCAGLASFYISKSIPAGLVIFWATSSAVSALVTRIKPLLSSSSRASKDARPIDGNNKKIGFVAPKRTLSLSKRQTMFLNDDMVPKHRGRR